MRRSRAVLTGVLAAVFCHCLSAQPPQAGEAAPEAKGMPPRASAAEYLSQGKAGKLTLAAEFKGHSIPTLDGEIYLTEDHVVVEVAFFGPEGMRTNIASSDFTLRINGKKSPLPGQPFAVVLSTLRNPDIEPSKAEEKSKTSMTSGGGGQQQTNEPPPPFKIPVPVLRAMGKKVQAIALPEGDRLLPQAGLIFFPHRGKVENITSLELLYAGPAGKATISLQP